MEEGDIARHEGAGGRYVPSRGAIREIPENLPLRHRVLSLDLRGSKWPQRSEGRGEGTGILQETDAAALGLVDPPP